MFEKIEFLVGYLKSMPIEKRYNSMGLENFSQTIEYYAGKKMLDADILGKELQQKILSGQPFMLARFGATELLCCSMYEFEMKSKRENAVDQLVKWSGFFPKSVQDGRKFYEMNVDAFREIDYLGVWFRRFEDYFIKKYLPKKSKISFLFDIEPWRSKDYPWTKALKGKKVLVIHPFDTTIVEQYNNHRTELFANQDILPEFELLTVKAVQTIAGIEDTRFKTWFEALDYMYNEAMKRDFDVAILGCGAYGLPLAAKIKQAGKQAIHLGGVTQILFGIKGKRWEEMEDYRYIKNLMNDAWAYPNEQDTPKNAKIVEGGCYWK